MSDTVTIRRLEESDIQAAMGLVNAEGWNQTEADWKLLINGKLNVCLAAEIDHIVVGTATAINYANEVAWIGMVLVNKDYRGRGISKVLLRDIFDQLVDCKSIKLDATPAGHPVYKKLNFKDEYLLGRMVNLSLRTNLESQANTAVRKISEKDFPAILKYDKQAFGSDRSHLIKSYVSAFPEKCLILKKDNEIRGFALGRKGNKYQHLGPVMAKSKEDAMQLVRSALFDLRGQTVVIDIMDDKQNLIKYMESFGFEKQRPFTRMYLNDNSYPGDTNQQYLISGPEFG